MSLVTIDASKCKGDAHCVASCPYQLLQLPEGSKTPRPVEGLAATCIRCGHCVAACPHEALLHQEIPLSECPRLQPELAVSFAQAEQLLRSRRSTRSYRERPVERETLAKLVDLAHFAPTGSNAQQVRWVVLHSPAAVKELTRHVIDMMKGMIEQKHPLTQSYPLDQLVGAWALGLDLVTYRAPALVIASAPKDYPLGAVDCTSALTYLDLAAPTLGLGTCWAGFMMLAERWYPPLKQAIAHLLPEGHACHGIMMVGYTKLRYHRLPKRNPVEIIWRD
jgi:nitroreductase/NAD-dependent dihydropyrimidine dehydrogenase PreA subunit